MEWQLQINLIKANTELFSRDDTSDRYAPALYEGLSVDVPLLVLSSPYYSLVPSLRTPPGEKWSGERISWADSPKVVGTNEIARLVIIT